MNKKSTFLFLSLLILPSCAPWNFRKRSVRVTAPQKALPKKAYLYISDIECEDCFSLIQGILSSIKGVSEVSLEGNDYKAMSLQPVVISYDSSIKLNPAHIRMMLEEWNFELQKIEI